MFFPSVHNIYLISQENCSRFVVEWGSDWVTGSTYLFQRFKKCFGLPLSAKSWAASAFLFHQSSFICLREDWTFLLHSLNFAVLERRPVLSISFLAAVLSWRRDWMDSLFSSNQFSIATWWRFQVFQHNFMGCSTYGLPLFTDRGFRLIGLENSA